VSTYRKVRDELAEQHDGGGDTVPCRYCGIQTDRETLTNLGARCRTCYEQFLRLGYSGGQPPRQHKQAPWVKAEGAKVRAKVGSNPMPGLEALSAAIAKRRAQREALAGMSDEDVNAMLASERGQR
jgi:hypothetical protein